MPPFAYLYEVKEIEGAPSPNAVTISPDTEYAPEPGFEVVPTKEAEVLVDYLLSLKVDYELPEAKFTE